MEKLFEHFTVTILKLNKLVQKIKIFEMKEYGLKSVHVMCIYFLDENGDGLTAGELARLTLEDKAAISRALKLLLEKGYIKYDPNKYNAKIILTAEGKKIAGEISVKADNAVKWGSADFTEEERASFYKSLGVITENLKSYYERLTGNFKNTSRSTV